MEKALVETLQIMRKIMCKKSNVVWGIVFTIFLVGCQSGHETGKRYEIKPVILNENIHGQYAEAENKKKDAIQMTHHIVWVLACLNKDLTDSRDLELQYNLLLADNLSYDVLDSETKEFAKHILDHINKLRIDAKEREILQEIYQQEKRKALFACLPANMAVIVDANWKQLLANVAQTLFYSYMNYKKIKESLDIQYKKDTWALDKQKWNDITTKNLRQLDDLERIFRKHRILEKEVVKKADVLYNDIVDAEFGVRRVDNVGLRFKKHSALKSKEYEEKYKNFAMYWFYRGILAYDYSQQTFSNGVNVEISLVPGSDLQDAEYCFNKFQELTERPVLTRDPIVAEVALRQIQLNLIKRVDDKKSIKKQLKLVKKNISFDKDFDKYLFCGIIYYKYLNDYAAALEMFKNSERILFSAFKKTVDKQFCDKLKPDEKYLLKTVENGYGFYITIDDQNIPLPSSDLLFFSKMARYYMAICAKKDQKLADDINKEITSYDSPLAAFFYGANVRENKTKLLYYNEILPKILKIESGKKYTFSQDCLRHPVGMYGFPYPTFPLIYDSNIWGKDTFYLNVPLAFTYLHNVKFRMEIHTKGKKIINMPLIEKETMMRVADKSKISTDDVTVQLCFEQEEDEIPKEAEQIVFVIKHDLFEFCITYDICSRKGTSRNADYYRNLQGKISFHLSPEMSKVYTSQ